MTFKVALVVPKTNIALTDVCPPLNLGYIASYLRSKNRTVEIRVFDGLAGDEPEHEIFLYEPAVVGITTTTSQVKDAYALADLIKHNRPDTIVVLGGSHVSAMPEEALAHADFVVVGEGEFAFADLVGRIQNGNVNRKGIIKGTPVDDLDCLPSPAFDLLKMDFYTHKKWIEQYLKLPTACLMTSRGCPYRCVFCYNNYRKTTVRWFSAERIVEEILILHKTYGVCSVVFEDDEFLVNTKRIKKLAQLFEETGISSWLKWVCQARVTTLNPDLIRLIEKMGCVLVVCGVESDNSRILRYLKACSVSVADNDRVPRLFSKSKVQLGINVIFGTPSESLKEMWQTVNYYLNNPEIAFMNVSVLTPNPSTKLWNDCKKLGLLPENVDYSQLIATAKDGFNVSTLSPTAFRRFLIHVNRIQMMVKYVRSNPSLKNFVFLGRGESWWWAWLFHPRIMLKLFCWLLARKK